MCLIPIKRKGVPKMPKASNPSEIKAQNRQQIFRFIRRNGPVSKQDIVIGLGLSLPTVTQNVQFLENLGLIIPSKVKKTGGRDATAYSYKIDGRHAIGVFFSNNHINAVCVDLSGEVVCRARERMPFNLDDENYLRKIAEIVETLKDEAKVSDKELLGVGIAVPSLVSDDGERIIHAMNRSFTGKTRAEIARYIPYPSRIFHDSYAAGFAEVWIDHSIRNALYISLNDTIGCSQIIGNHIYCGDNNRAGELGHLCIVPKGGKLCYCGKRGCFDTLCNVSVLDSYTDGNLPEFFRLLKEGDSGAGEIWDEYLDNLALTIHNMRMLFDCTIIIGGYVGAFIEDYLDDLCARVDVRDSFGDPAIQYVKPCKYKIETTAAGAAIQIIADFIRNI